MATDRKIWALSAAAGLIGLGRSFVFFAVPELNIDGDQAVVGLMAKHVASGEAFPLYFYGQKFLLAINAWLGALSFVVGGVSFRALEFPWMVLNAGFAAWLVVLLHRECLLRPLDAFIASLFFAAAPVVTTSRLMAPSVACIESFYYLTGLWLLRARPLFLGAFFAFALAARTFALYGLVTLLAMWWLQRDRGRSLRDLVESQRARILRFVAGFAAIRVILALASLFAANYYGRTAPGPSISVIPLIPRNLELLFRELIPTLFGLGRTDYARWSILSESLYDGRWLSVVALIWIAFGIYQLRELRLSELARKNRFAVYWIGCGVLTLIAFVVFLQIHSIMSIRYITVALLVPVAFAAIWMGHGRSSPVSGAIARSGIIIWAAAQLYATTTLGLETWRAPPRDDAHVVLDEMREAGIALARGNHSLAYRVSFLSGETIRIDAPERSRIQSYRRAVDDEAATVDSVPWVVEHADDCPDGYRVYSSREPALCLPNDF